MKPLEPIDRIAIAGVLPLALLALIRALPIDDGFPLVAIEAELGWLLVPAWLALIVEAVRRRAIGIAIAAWPCAVHLALVGALLVPHARAATDRAPRFRVVSANLLAFQDHPEDLARELATYDADVMVLVELTPEHLEALEEARVIASFSRDDSVVIARDDCFGIALLSRFPMTHREIVEHEGLPRVRATLDVHGTPVRVHAVHTFPPVGEAATALWREQVDAVIADVATERAATIVVGDLNLTPFGRAYGRLESVDLRGAHELAGRGLAVTWPNGTRWMPPMRLDHVLVSSRIDALAAREGTGHGSDHRPVIADLAIVE